MFALTTCEKLRLRVISIPLIADRILNICAGLVTTISSAAQYLSVALYNGVIYTTDAFHVLATVTALGDFLRNLFHFD